MILKSFEGIYRNGRVELNEIPSNMSDETPVIVTFLKSEQIDLRSRGISEEQVAYLRASLATFAEDWDSNEMGIYDNYDANKAQLPSR